MNKLFFFLLILVSLTGCKNTNENTSFSKNELTYLLDESSSLEINDVKKANFKKHEGKTPNFGFYKGTVWLKIVTNQFDKDDILEIKNSNIDQISLFTFQKNGYHLKEETGDLFPFHHRKIKHRFFHFKLNSSDTILLKVNNNGKQLFIPLSIRSKDKYAARDYDEQFIFGIYYGLCLFALILNLFIFSRIRERSTLMYLFYLAGLIFLQLALDGHGFEYFWSNSSYVANHAPGFAASFSVYFLALFTQLFLQTKHFLPKSHRILTLISYIILINLLLSLIPSTHQFSILAINIITLLFNLFILPIAFVTFKKKFKPARYFLLAFVILIFSSIAFILRNFGVLPSSFLTDYSLQIGSIFEITLLTFAIVDRFKSFKTEALLRLEELNKLQAEQNEKLAAEVAARTQEINDQKILLEIKNKETLDSINYAKRIQTALIPSEATFNSYFTDAFTLWEPKDIISGDFYWASTTTTTLDESENKSLTVFCVGDCTGHGVPGAIISVIGLKLLNLSISNSSINSTSEALDFLHDQFKKTFQNDSNNHVIRDGMDVSICAIDKINNTLYFSGAKNGIYIIRNNELIELKGDKQSIGAESQILNYTQHTFDLQKGDAIYLYSDGFADQFGGEKGKKFMYKPLKDLILANSSLPMSEQKAILYSAFIGWKGNLEQTDDVCIVGVRV